MKAKKTTKTAAKKSSKTTTKPSASAKTRASISPVTPGIAVGPATAPPAPSAVQGSQAAYNQFEEAALALDPADVRSMHTDPSLAYHNAAIGVASLQARAAQIKAAIPGVDIDALSLLPQQCLALMFADQLAHAADASTGEIAALMAQATTLRAKLFLWADALVSSAELTPESVAACRLGPGKIQTAKSLVGLGKLFTANAAALKQTALTKADIAQAQSLGTQLETLLKPKTAKRGRSPEAVKAADMRDRMWTLVEQTHEALWCACAYVYGPHGIAAAVPPLGSHAATTSTRKKANAAKKLAAKATATPATPATPPALPGPAGT